MLFPDFKFESEKYAQGYTHVIGCDEVGVGPIAGPVVAAACILNPELIKGYRSKNKWYYRVRDSKTTSEKERAALIQEIRDNCICFGIGEVNSETIDRINIHQASLLAMRLAIENMLIKIGDIGKVHLFIDGRFTVRGLDERISQTAVIDGDAKILSISSASIIAKVHRDKIMSDFDVQFPGYDFSKHKGYNTEAHTEAVLKKGITPIHRKSFLGNLSQRALF